MIRTQIRLDERQYELARREASALGISLAEFVRRAIRQMLPSEAGEPWMRYAGFISSRDEHSSQSIAEVVYRSSG